MSAFCSECSVVMFGEDFKELANLCALGETAIALCEGARKNCDGGFIVVDANGKKVGGYGKNIPPRPGDAEHYYRCSEPGCDLLVDKRDLSQVFLHEHKALPLDDVMGIKGEIKE